MDAGTEAHVASGDLRQGRQRDGIQVRCALRGQEVGRHGPRGGVQGRTGGRTLPPVPRVDQHDGHHKLRREADVTGSWGGWLLRRSSMFFLRR
uniref:Uncharacterized protein n=1 Tax=uncultured bacterium r_03 TaxID=1132278 RepID=I6XP34_9BACT|nr:hypothetical protein [uncultured bacterium r_03]